MEFKVGDIVFYTSSLIEPGIYRGTITYIDNFPTMYQTIIRHHVRWDNGSEGSYLSNQLLLDKETIRNNKLELVLDGI